MSEDILVYDGYQPGSIGQMLTLHMDYYGPEWGLGQKFEIYCAGGMAAFFSDFDPDRDFFLAARNAQGEMLGSIVIDGREAMGEGARLRWFIVDQRIKGAGTGTHLLEQAMAFCQSKGFGDIFLATFAGLEASRHLYEKAGFRLVEKKTGDPWSGEMGERIFRYESRSRNHSDKPG